MHHVIFQKSEGPEEKHVDNLRALLSKIDVPFKKGNSVGVKIHWGERGNHSYLSPTYTATIVSWLRTLGISPFVFDTTVLYSGGRRTGEDALKTAYEHGFTEKFLGCPVVVADGMDGRSVIDIAANYRHFEHVQVTDIIAKCDGFVVFSHFKGHLGAGFGGSIKNISMGFASRAQKQRMHADAHPVLQKKLCTRCGTCAEICPAGAITINSPDFPEFNLDTCIGCAQCIAQCPEVALKIFWNADNRVFLERLVETASAVWKLIHDKTICINALVKVATDCDCLPGDHSIIAPDWGFIGGCHPVTVDKESVNKVGAAITRAHSSIPWGHQFSYASEIGFDNDSGTMKKHER